VDGSSIMANRVTSWDLDAVWHDFVHGRNEHGERLTIPDVTKLEWERSSHGNIEQTSLRRMIAHYATRHDWEARRIKEWHKQEKSDEPEIPMVDTVVETQGELPYELPVADTAECPHCGKILLVPEESFMALGRSADNMRKVLDREIKLREGNAVGEAPVKELSDLTVAMERTQKLIERNAASVARIKADTGDMMLDADGVNELKRIGAIFMELCSRAPADDPEIIDLRKKLENAQ